MIEILQKAMNERDESINHRQQQLNAAEGTISDQTQQLKAQIDALEAKLPLKVRIERIFDQKGITIAAIYIGSLNSALKPSNKLTIEYPKSPPPGIVSEIATFIFKVASQAVGFIANNAWILIVVAVLLALKK